jgi:hypothetical protein
MVMRLFAPQFLENNQITLAAQDRMAARARQD